MNMKGLDITDCGDYEITWDEYGNPIPVFKVNLLDM